MKTKNKLPSKLDDFFGSKNEYRVFAIKSSLSLIPFAAQFERITSSSFSFLTEFYADEDKNKAQFGVMYSLISEQENLHCAIIENKTNQFSTKNTIPSKVEKNLSFQTLSLFEDVLYMFNNEGLTIFKTPLPYYDFLIFIHVEKGRNIDSFVKTILNHKDFKTIDISSLIYITEEKQNKKIGFFLKNIFCSIEVSIGKFHQNKIQTLLGPIYKIPESNLVNPLKVQIESQITENLTLNVNPEYIRLLTNEVDSL